MEKAPPLVLLGGADAHDLVLVEMLIDDYPNIIFVVLTSLNPIIPLRPCRGYKKDVARENPDKIGVFTVYTAKFQRTVLTDIKMMFSLCWMS